jgi:hypothetical protein
MRRVATSVEFGQIHQPAVAGALAHRSDILLHLLQ